MSLKKQTFVNHLRDEFTDDMSPAEQSKSIVDVRKQLQDAIVSNTTAEKFFLLAQECDKLSLKEEHDIALRHAATRGHLEASFLYASMQVVSAENADFLLDHCRRVDADPRCLTLLSQTMETLECKLEFQPAVCLELVNRAIARAQSLSSSNRKWRNALFIALCERARLVLNHNLVTDAPSWTVAETTLLPITQTKLIKTHFCVRNLEMMDYFMLMGRINDTGRNAEKKVRQDALSYYRKSMEIALKLGEPAGFLQARIATLTPDLGEAERLLPLAIAWLDDLGVGKNDAEMPDLVERFVQLCPQQAQLRTASLFPVPQPLLAAFVPQTSFLLPPLSALDLLSPPRFGAKKRQTDDDSYFPFAKRVDFSTSE